MHGRSAGLGLCSYNNNVPCRTGSMGQLGVNYQQQCLYAGLRAWRGRSAERGLCSYNNNVPRRTGSMGQLGVYYQQQCLSAGLRAHAWLECLYIRLSRCVLPAGLRAHGRSSPAVRRTGSMGQACIAMQD